MEHSSSSLFKPEQPHQPVATLMLIENSQAMSLIWPDLRDRYLDRLVDSLVHANPSVPITVSVLESYPCQNHGRNASPPRQYSGYHDGLHDLNFNSNPANKITAGRINSCIEFLDTAKFQGQPPARHLIIVAATSPSDDDNGMAFTGNVFSPWLFLAQKMGSKNIHCHIVVSPQHDMGPLTLLFEETLRLQGNIEESLYPPADPKKMMLRLSARPSYEPRNDTRPSSSFPGGRVGAPRRNSYPLDNFYPETFDESTGAPVSSEGDQPPTLVSQLQQVHGLTKKKVYGAKPVRQPFFREERVRDKYRQAPAPLTMPLPVMEQAPSPTAGGRALSQSRADRMSRVGQGSPTDLHSRRQHGWTRRGSRLSTPEPDGLPWPPSPSAHPHDTSPGSSSYMSSDLSSPVTPVTTIEEIYGQPTCIPQPSVHGVSPVSAYQTGGSPESNWSSTIAPQYLGSYNPGVQTYFPPVTHQFYAENGQIVQPPPQPSSYSSLPPPNLQPPPQQSVLPPSSYHSPPSSAPNMQTPPIVPSQPVHVPMNTSTICPPAALNVAPAVPLPDRNVASNPNNSRAHKKAASEEDEERFTFGKDFVAATAVLFESEVLPAYPDYPGMSSGLYTAGVQQTLPPTLPASQAGELYASRNKQNVQPTAMNMVTSGPLQRQPAHLLSSHHAPISNMVNNTATAATTAACSYSLPGYPPNYGSSLTGWAG